MITALALEEIKKLKKQFGQLMAGSILGSLLLLLQAWLLAAVVDRTFLEHQPVSAVWTELALLAAVIILRAGQQLWQKKKARRIALKVKQSLRQRLAEQLMALGAQQRSGHGEVVHLLTDGLDQVDTYMTSYIPQMGYALLVPLVMGLGIVSAVPWVGIILLVTIPVIPFFMILIGKKAEKMNQAQWERMSFLSGHFLDVLQGITTLKLFGRSREQIKVIARLAGEFRDSTLKVLRVAFLSAFVLELAGTISTALIAVYMGVYLLYGEIAFRPAFFVLLLAPEFYAPLRQLGSAFHAGMAGNTSLAKIAEFLALKREEPAGGTILPKTGGVEEVAFEQVTYTYTGGSEPAVHGLSLKLQRSRKVMLVGESGAGKSTAAHLLLRLMKPQEGHILVDGTDLMALDSSRWRQEVAFVPQQPHLFSGTIAENIAFGRPASREEIIEAAIQAEAHNFIIALPEGYDTPLGEGGAGLSGGERQRIALARAFLKKASVLILDEVSAHLDVETEQSLARALQRLMVDKAVLLIGHRLETMTWADQLVVMRQGEIVETGTYEELIRQKGYFRELLQAGIPAYMDEGGLTGSAESTSAAITAKSTSAGMSTEDTSAAMTDGKDTCEAAGIRLLRQVLRRARKALWGALLFEILTVFFNIALLATSAWLISTAALRPELSALGLAIVGVRFYGISRAVCRYIERNLSHYMAFQSLYALRVWFYEKLEPLAPAILQKLGSGDLLGRIMADIETLQFYYLRCMIPPMTALVLTVLMALFLLQFSPLLALLPIIGLLLAWAVIPRGVLASGGKATAKAQSLKPGAKAGLVETLDGLMDIITYDRRSAAGEKLLQDFAGLDEWEAKAQVSDDRGESAFLVLVQGTVLAAVTMSAGMAYAGRFEGVYIAVIALGLQAWFEALEPLTLARHYRRRSLLAAEGLLRLEHEKAPVQDRGKELPQGSSIEFSHVAFSYGDRRIYRDLSLQVKAGMHVAVVGPSGAGKTTLLTLLARFREYSGSIRLGGTELQQIPQEEVRSQFSVAAQDTYIFHATLEENIRLAKPEASPEELAKAITFARLDGVTARLPEGLNTIIGRGGQGLSGGERQRVALARIYLRQAPILLLDESLEGLDQLTRHSIYQSLQEVMEGKTVLYITHYLTGLEKMDRIIFMDQGEILEEGSYEELMKRRGMFYTYVKLSMAGI